ncbi:C-X-C motif chemokine 6-like isoform X2 [Thalassophryne amazonica]|nr:C-X-C motif chemokine 6-like isoform X2 [Thalassophryne amazonica]
MCSITKVLLLLAVMVCITAAQRHGGEQCLCQGLRNMVNMKSGVKSIQMYPASVFCSTVEIVITPMRGMQYCLNPNTKQVKFLLSKLM